MNLTYTDNPEPEVVPSPPGQAPGLWTVGAIADHLGVPVHRVRYQVDRHSIDHTARAGRVRLFNRHAVADIRAGLRRADARVGGDR